MLIQFDVFVSNWILKNTKIQIHSSTFTERPKMWTTANGIGIGTIEKSITEVYCEYIHCRYIVHVHGRIQKMQHWFFNSSAPSSLVFHSPYVFLCLSFLPFSANFSSVLVLCPLLQIVWCHHLISLDIPSLGLSIALWDTFNSFQLILSSTKLFRIHLSWLVKRTDQRHSFQIVYRFVDC